ncbi:DUF3757 domain-containing protein [Thiotrichales bacterium 19S9-12]|nr:DUF3757 domain-containing protein [Thiotrichales bacterium 19S9-11]MCF6811628.1 DUF3757 domain-containing protein [Thiotrichales bacterium 19S9-12]
MIKKVLFSLLIAFPMVSYSDGFVQYPVMYHCPAFNEVSIQTDGSFEAVTYINGLSIQWQGAAIRSEVGVKAVAFQKAVLACDSQTCMVFCDYNATGKDDNVIRLTISELNISFHKAMAGGYGTFWSNNQCQRNNNRDCAFQIVEDHQR